jgi:predicted metalloendopeptidase
MIDPVFDPYAPARERYGRLGAIIAHEMAHAALTPIVHDEEISVDMAILDARAPIDACLGSDALPIEEVWADLLGLQTAWVAWRRDTDERDDAAAAQDFFTAYAQFFCTALADTADAREIESDARTRARINAAMGHAPAFAEAFGCPAEAPMHATDACDPW